MTSSNGRSVSTTMPSATSRPLDGSSSRLQRLRRVIRRSARTVDGDAIAARLVEAHDQVAAAVVGALHRVELDARVVDVTTGAGDCVGRAAPHDPQRHVEPLGLGSTSCRPGAVRAAR